MKILDEHKCVLYNTNYKEHKSVLQDLRGKEKWNMENTMKMYITMKLLNYSISRGYAYKVIRGLK